ncbi:glycoside hydrolase family 13 protein, partial [Myxococcota bacterium]|nr:glycoside hydrolase family 13 protein [Myxococcota bacterium]
MLALAPWRPLALTLTLLASPLGPAWGCPIQADELAHEPFGGLHRAPPGPRIPGDWVRLRVRAAQGDLDAAVVYVLDPREAAPRRLGMHWDGEADDREDMDLWAADLQAWGPARLRYAFEVSQGQGAARCRAFLGAEGIEATLEAALASGFTLTVYDPGFEVPAWLREAIIYQVFPDRFRDGDPQNNRPPGSFHYGGESLARSGAAAWNTAICDPGVEGPCAGSWSKNFYGGDLNGLADKVEAGYFDALGVTVLYLNPIFASPSNHRYDASDYHAIDADLGGLVAFQRLTRVAQARGLRLILDGVFNHTSSDALYFDRYGRYEAVGACEDEASPYRGWFYLPDIGAPASGGQARCAGDVTYESWWGYSSMPKLNAAASEVRDFFFGGPQSVASRWLIEGASGWRLDVGADVDKGFADNDFWESMREAIRRDARRDAVLIGEEWGDPTPWLLGREWDSAMHYPLRSLLLNFVFTGCQGPGCVNGRRFEDGDSNGSSPLGAIEAITPSAVDWHLRAYLDRLPPPALYAMMNLAGSHDTSRLSFLLRKISGDDPERAARAGEVLWSALFTLPGAPTIYYGDEIGLISDSVYREGRWHDDPYNRAPFPWPDTPGDLEADLEAQALLTRLASLRQGYPPLISGALIPGALIDGDVYAYGRRLEASGALIYLNRGAAVRVDFEAARRRAGLPEGAWIEALGRGDPDEAGQISLPEMSARIFILDGQADTPKAPRLTAARPVEGGLELSFEPTWMDTAGGREAILSYLVEHQDGRASVTVTPPRFGGPLRVRVAPVALRVRAKSLLAVSAPGPWIDPRQLPEGQPVALDGGVEGVEDASTPRPRDVGPPRGALADAGAEPTIEGDAADQG